MRLPLARIIFGFSHGRATQNICRRARICVRLPLFLFLRSDSPPLAGGFVFGRRPPLHIPPLVSEPPKKTFPPGAFSVRPAGAANM